MTMETDSWSHSPVKGESNLASDNIRPCAHSLKSNKGNSNSSEFFGLDSILDDKISIADSNSFDYPKGDINRTGNDINYFENAENKYSSDLLYCDWPEIENFEDIDTMFRSCGSTFGLGVCREDELGCLPSDDAGVSEDVIKLDVKFLYPEPNEVGNISEKDDFSNGYSISDSSMISPPIRYKDSSWTSNKSDSYRSFVIGLDIANSKDSFNPREKGHDKVQPIITTNSHFGTGSAAVSNEHKSQIKQETQMEGKGKEHCPQNYKFGHVTDLPNESGELSSGLTPHQNLQSVHMQQEQLALAPYSYTYSQNPIMHSDNSQFSNPSSVHPKPFGVKFDTDDVTPVSPRDSSHVSSQLQYMEGIPDPGFKATALAMCGQRKKLHYNLGNLPVYDHQKDESVTWASMSGPELGGKCENHRNTQAVCLATLAPAELGSSNTQESSTMCSYLDDISLDAATFQQLQLVTDQLDLRTKLCIRDSLYRLAQSAEQRHNHANMNAGCGGGDTGTKMFTSFMDMETDTNPIDRSVAQLLFHRPSDSIPFKSSRVLVWLH